MSDFDPNTDPETQEQADAYINWCAENFERLSQGPDRNYRTALRCATWLLVIASAQLHLDDDIEHEREALLGQLAMYQALARAIERQRQHFAVERLIVLRASLDCWESSGEWGEHLLNATKCAVSVLILTEVHPLVALWELPCPDAWALLDTGAQQLAEINLADELSFQDFAIAPDEMATAQFTWQTANNIVRRVGSPPLSPN